VGSKDPRPLLVFHKGSQQRIKKTATQNNYKNMKKFETQCHLQGYS
jgi:hypothetical protein